MARRLLLARCMSNAARSFRHQPETYLELVAEPPDELETADEPTLVKTLRRTRDDEPTQPFDFDPPEPAPEEKLVIGYLTMEQNGMFAELSLDEQEEVASTLRR